MLNIFFYQNCLYLCVFNIVQQWNFFVYQGSFEYLKVSVYRMIWYGKFRSFISFFFKCCMYVIFLYLYNLRINL